MKEFSLRWIDIAAGLCWVACAATALDVTAGGSDRLRPWIVVVAVLGALCSCIAWLSRRLDHLENHVYTEGMRVGLEAKKLLHIPEQHR